MKFIYDKKTATVNAHGQTVYYTPFPFAWIAWISRVDCSDGKQRNAFCSGCADTYSTVPAYVNVGKRTVSGHIFMRDDRWAFAAYPYRKNADALPAWPIE